MNKKENQTIMDKLLDEKDTAIMPKVGDLIKGKILSIGTNEIYIDIPGITVGLVRGKELASDLSTAKELKVDDQVSATVIDFENEKGILELSLRSAGHLQIWQRLRDLVAQKTEVEVKVLEANKGGLMVSLDGKEGFLPVSQLSRENYPRVEGGSKSKILEKLRSLVAKKLKVKVIDIDEREEKIIFSEREVYAEDKKMELEKFKVGQDVEVSITGLVDFGVFVEFGNGLEGLIHISELAWQRIDHPKDLFKVGDKIKAQIISIDGDKVTLSAKKLVVDPWKKAAEKYKIGDKVKGKVLKIDKFGVFVELDNDIHGLAHISELSEDKIESAEDAVKIGQSYDFKVVSIEPEDHRLGLSMKGV